MVNNKDINRRVNFQKNYVEFLPTADKDSQQSKNTESSQHILSEDRQARANSVLTWRANA